MFRTELVEEFNDSKLNGTYIVLINPNRIPHLIIVQNGSYYSLTNKICLNGIPFEPYFNKLKKAKKKMLFVSLSTKTNIDFNQYFENFSTVDSQEITCLAPIKMALKSSSKAKFIFEFLPEINADGLISGYSHINMGELLEKDSTFILNTYSKEDIFNYIRTLNRKNEKHDSAKTN